MAFKKKAKHGDKSDNKKKKGKGKPQSKGNPFAEAAKVGK